MHQQHSTDMSADIRATPEQWNSCTPGDPPPAYSEECPRADQTSRCDYQTTSCGYQTTFFENESTEQVELDYVWIGRQRTEPTYLQSEQSDDLDLSMKATSSSPAAPSPARRYPRSQRFQQRPEVWTISSHPHQIRTASDHDMGNTVRSNTSNARQYAPGGQCHYIYQQQIIMVHPVQQSPRVALNLQPLNLPKDYTSVSAFSVFCGFMPLGLVALALSYMARKAKYHNDMENAKAFGLCAFKFAIVSITLGIAFFIAMMILGLRGQL